jgi:hypothetical protein
VTQHDKGRVHVRKTVGAARFFFSTAGRQPPKTLAMAACWVVG